MALNVQQVTGVHANRELPVVWAVCKGSFVNKIILVPAALLLSAVAAGAIKPLMIACGAYLCFEGCEKLAHRLFHSDAESKHRRAHAANVAAPNDDIVNEEQSKISSAVRTDFILSAEIIVITLGTVADAEFMTQLTVLVSISVLMTVGVYGLVAGIVKLDDLGLRLMNTQPERSFAGPQIRAGHAIVAATPYFMKFLSIVGTAAMFLVGGGILAHGIPLLHHSIEDRKHLLEQTQGIGGVLGWCFEVATHGLVGVLMGAAVLAIVSISKTVYGNYAK